MWAVLHEGVIAGGGGDDIETDADSGPRQNPWVQEASDRITRRGEIVALDTDGRRDATAIQRLLSPIPRRDHRPTGANAALQFAAEQLRTHIAALAP